VTIFLVLLFDQILKFWVKTHMTLGEEIPVFGNWFIIHFTENRGMAFGMEFGGSFGKLFLSLFRIVAVGLIGYYLWSLIKKGAKSGIVICLSFILAGALGNIIDSVFYGLIFSDSYFHVASFLPKEGSYGTFLHGKVVDMLYFPVIDTTWPSWVPFWGGQDFQFFRPVFNIADSSISVGVAILIIFQRHFISKEKNENPVHSEEVNNESITETS
jgi:signal peptidase II